MPTSGVVWLRARRPTKVLALVVATMLGTGVLADAAAASSSVSEARTEVQEGRQETVDANSRFFQATTCAGRGLPCQWIGTSQVALWVALALGESGVKSFMNELFVQANMAAPIEVVTDITNSAVIVRLHVKSIPGAEGAINQPTSLVSVAFDNSMDKSAASTGLRLGPLRDTRYGPPRPGMVAATTVVAPTDIATGSIRVKTANIETVPIEVWSILNEDITEVIPTRGIDAGAPLRQNHSGLSLPVSNITRQQHEALENQLVMAWNLLQQQERLADAITSQYGMLAIMPPPGYTAAVQRLAFMTMAMAQDRLADLHQYVAHLQLIILNAVIDG